MLFIRHSQVIDTINHATFHRYLSPVVPVLKHKSVWIILCTIRIQINYLGLNFLRLEKFLLMFLKVPCLGFYYSQSTRQVHEEFLYTCVCWQQTIMSQLCTASTRWTSWFIWQPSNATNTSSRDLNLMKTLTMLFWQRSKHTVVQNTVSQSVYIANNLRLLMDLPLGCFISKKTIYVQQRKKCM